MNSLISDKILSKSTVSAYLDDSDIFSIGDPYRLHNRFYNGLCNSLLFPAVMDPSDFTTHPPEPPKPTTSKPPKTNSTDSPPIDHPDNRRGIPPGGVAGIVIVVLLLVGLILFGLAYYFLKIRNKFVDFSLKFLQIFLLIHTHLLDVIQ